MGITQLHRGGIDSLLRERELIKVYMPELSRFHIWAELNYDIAFDKLVLGDYVISSSNTMHKLLARTAAGFVIASSGEYSDARIFPEQFRGKVVKLYCE